MVQVIREKILNHLVGANLLLHTPSQDTPRADEHR